MVPEKHNTKVILENNKIMHKNKSKTKITRNKRI
jgi:hypothetical protein